VAAPGKQSALKQIAQQLSRTRLIHWYFDAV